MSIVIQPTSQVTGKIKVPGDKSISHRYAILAALSEGTSIITNYAPGADCASTLRCLEILGVRISKKESTDNLINEGDLLLFPSYLPHKVESNKSSEDRIVISFNIDCR